MASIVSISVTVMKSFDELVRADAVQIGTLARALRQIALRARKLQWPGAGRQAPGPGALRIHEVTLHVEYELALAELGRRQLCVLLRLVGDVEETAAAAGARMRGIERQQGGSGAAERSQKSAARAAQLARQLTGPFTGEKVGVLQ